MRRSLACLMLAVLGGCAADHTQDHLHPEPQLAALVNEERAKISGGAETQTPGSLWRSHLDTRSRRPLRIFDQVPESVEYWDRTGRALR